MSFPTVEFACFFSVVFAFTWALNSYNFIKKCTLLAFSLAFYASWNVHFVTLLLVSGAVSFGCGLYVEKPRKGRRAVLFLSVAFHLGVLGYFKYLDFFIAELMSLAQELGVNIPLGFVNVALPVAISFLTFHVISYSVDVYRGRISASRSLVDVLLYVSFFPHLVAGPIVRAHEFLPQLQSPRRAEDFAFGETLLLILGGLFKKMVIANDLAVLVVDPIFTDPTQFSRSDLMLGLYAYAVQIYADFSAYTDIAIGIAALLGYRFPQNFNQPYRALGVGDFWRRWHMSLSAWLRDYVYIPLGGNRHWPARNLMITMLLGGLWHGANVTFVLWGGLHGAALVADHVYRKSALCRHYGQRVWARALDGVITFHIVTLGWLIFRAPSLDVVGQYLSSLRHSEASSQVPLTVWPLLALGLVTQYTPPDSRQRLGAWLERRGMLAMLFVGGGMLWLILIMAPDSSAPFIYFQF